MNDSRKDRYPVYESDDNPVVRTSELEEKLAPIRSELRLGKYAIGFLAAAVASPKLGGPSASQLLTSSVQFLLG